MRKDHQKTPESNELMRLKNELDLLKHQLSARKKELHCLNQITKWMNDDQLNTNKLISNITNILTESNPNAEKTAAKITIHLKTFQSKNYFESPHFYQESIFNNGHEIGKIELFFHLSDPKETFDIQAEEKHFLNTISTQIAHHLNSQNQIEGFNKNISLYQSLFFNSPDGFLLIEDGFFIDANPVAIEMIGYSKEELIGKQPHEISPPYQSNGKSSKDYANDLISKAKSEGKNSFEWQHQRKDGSILFVSVHLNIWIFKGQEILFTTWRDITDKKKADEELLKYKTIADKSNYGIAINSLDGIFLYVNKAWADMHHYKAEELVGQHISICHTEEQMEITGREIEKLIKSGSMAPMELYHLTKNKEIFPTLTGATVIKNAHGHPLFLSANCIDISELKNTYQLLENHNNKLRSLVLAVPDTILHIKKDGTYIDFIRPVDELNSPIIKAPHISDLICERNLALYEKMIRKCKREQQLLVFEHDHIGKKELEYREARLIPLGNEEVLAIIRDTSEQVKSNLTIKKLSLAIEQSPVMVLITDINANIEYVNQAFLNITGYKKEFIQGKNTRVLKSGKNDPQLYIELWNDITSGNIWQGEWISQKQDRSFYWEHITITPIFNNKKEIINYVAIKQDISERKAKEVQIKELTSNLESKVNERTEALQVSNEQLLEEVKERKKSETKFATSFKMGSAMMTLNYADTGEFIDVNDIYTEVLGYTREDVFSGYLTQRLVEENDPAINEVFELLAKGETISKRELNIPTKNGAYKTVLYSSDLIFLDNRPVNLSVAVDISDRKAAEQELIIARKEAEKANKIKSEFLANMSHEIRTPMNAVLGYTDLLNKQITNPTQKTYLENIQISGQTLLRIINDILDILKIEAGKLELEYQFVNIKNFFLDFEKIFQLKAFEKGLDFMIHLDSKLPEFIKVDETRLRQILINIIGNAVKFTKHGFVMIVIHQLHKIKSKGIEKIQMEILVKDSGPGIPHHMQSEIFNEFVQVKHENNIGGTGLGLPISKKLIKMMNGEIELESKPGDGSIFRILLPDLEIVERKKTELTSSSSPMQFEFENNNILVVDDIQLNIDFIKDVLSNDQLSIIQAKNGLEALEKLKENEIHLVITDIRMPHMDGYELLNTIRNDEKYKHIPVVAYSASLVKKDEDDLKQKFSAFLSKPLEMDVLFETLTRLLKPANRKETPKNLKTEEQSPMYIQDQEGLIHQMETILSNQYQKLIIRQPIDQVKEFSQQLIEAGKKHHCSILEDLGRELAESADNFDIKKMIPKIHEFKKIKETIIKHRNHG